MVLVVELAGPAMRFTIAAMIVIAPAFRTLPSALPAAALITALLATAALLTVATPAPIGRAGGWGLRRGRALRTTATQSRKWVAAGKAARARRCSSVLAAARRTGAAHAREWVAAAANTAGAHASRAAAARVSATGRGPAAARMAAARGGTSAPAAAMVPAGRAAGVTLPVLGKGGGDDGESGG
jgi:hypothetical protein